VYKYGGCETASGYTRTDSQTSCTPHIPVPPYASIQSERAGFPNRRPQSYTCTGVGRLGFLGAYSRLLALSARPTLIQFFIAGTIRGTARRTSACIDCVLLHRTYTRDVSCEWSHGCLEHQSLRGIHSVLRICAYFIVVYCLCE
jgi:hypothetical protein